MKHFSLPQSQCGISTAEIYLPITKFVPEIFLSEQPTIPSEGFFDLPKYLQQKLLVSLQICTECMEQVVSVILRLTGLNQVFYSNFYFLALGELLILETVLL